MGQFKINYILRSIGSCIIAIILCGLLLLLAGCAKNNTYRNIPNKNSNSVPAKLIDNLRVYIAKLPQYEGEHFIFVIPRQRLFDSDTAGFTDSGKELLSKIAQITDYYDIEEMKINSFLFLPKAQLEENTKVIIDYLGMGKLAKVQAKNVASYLGNKNGKIRLIFADGFFDMKSNGGDCIMIDFIVYKKI